MRGEVFQLASAQNQKADFVLRGPDGFVFPDFCLPGLTTELPEGIGTMVRQGNTVAKRSCFELKS